MGFMLGNLSVNQIEERLGISFPKDIHDFMEQTREQNASNVGRGKWHCFDLPFTIVCGDMETAQKIYDSVKDKSKDVKEQLVFSLSNKNNEV